MGYCFSVYILSPTTKRFTNSTMGIKDKLKRTSKYFVNEPKENGSEPKEVDSKQTEPTTEAAPVDAAEPATETVDGDATKATESDALPLPEVGVTDEHDLGDAVDAAAKTEASPEETAPEAVPATEAETGEGTVEAEAAQPATEEAEADKAEKAADDVQKAPSSKEKKNDFLKKLLQKFRRPAKST